MTQTSPRIAIVLPRGTHFGPSAATSIDLCVRDFVASSRYRETTFIHCGAVPDPFPGFNIRFDKGRGLGQWAKTLRIARRIRADSADLIVVHQHLPTANLLALMLPVPILLHTHNFQKTMKPSISRYFRALRYRQMAGIALVSHACREDFLEHWPDINRPTFVAHNGLDLAHWKPATQRRKEILFVGRAAPEKGALEAIKAIARVLPFLHGWTGRFILSEPAKHQAYFNEIEAIAVQSQGRITLSVNQTHDVVKEAYETAEIALVTSKWREPFGRTAIEAHAGGGALISSGRGGLREISEETCLYVDPDNVDDIQEQILSLASSPDLCNKLRQNASARTKAHFDVTRVSAVLDDIYDCILR